jgi:hypothetical protein
MASPFFRSKGQFFFSFMFHCSFLHRFANQAAWFVNAYREGLSGVQAAWANKKYHGHRTLPPESIFEAKEAIA